VRLIQIIGLSKCALV